MKKNTTTALTIADSIVMLRCNIIISEFLGISDVICPFSSEKNGEDTGNRNRLVFHVSKPPFTSEEDGGNEVNKLVFHAPLVQ